MSIYYNIEKYCQKHGISISAFEKKCNIGNGVVGSWRDGNYEPSLKTINKISLATGIPVSEWVKDRFLDDNKLHVQ